MKNGDCPKCKSKNITLTPCIDEEDGKLIPNLYDGHCNDCGWDFLMIDL